MIHTCQNVSKKNNTYTMVWWFIESQNIHVHVHLQGIIHINLNHDHRLVWIQFSSVYDVALYFSIFHVRTFLFPYKHVVWLRLLGIFSLGSRDWDVRLGPWSDNLRLGTCARDGSQDAFGVSFRIFLSDGGRMALTMPLETHFEHLFVLVARLLSECFWTRSL